MIDKIATVLIVVSWMALIYFAGKGNLLALIPKILQERLNKTEKVGKWEMYIDDYEICATEIVCTHCRESFATELTDEEFLEMMKYCPHCGAKMRCYNDR